MDKTERKEQRRMKKEQKNNLVAFNAENDIKYRAPFGINHVRTMAWICIVIMQITVLAGTIKSISKIELISDGGIQAIQMLASMSVPLFLLASFSYILQNKEKCGRIILFYLAMSAIIPILFSIIFFHFGAGIVESFFMNANESVQETVNRFAADAFGEALNCNIFIDMLLFSSLTFFLTAKPKSEFFSGKKIYIFRAFALIPVLYEIAAFVYRLLWLSGAVVPSLFVYVFMPTKAPLTFIAFALVLAFEISKQRRYMKLGGTEEGYAEFFATNKNSFMFAKSTAKTFAFVGLVDFLFIIIWGIIMYVYTGNMNDFEIISKIGLGKSADLMLIAPFTLLFSYNRKPKIANYNLILPIFMIFLIILAYIEAGYIMLTGKL